MGQVTVTLNGRTYRLRCGDGEEERLIALADHVRGKLDTLVAQYGQAGDDRLLLMAALLIADELWDARTQLAAHGSGGAEVGRAGRPQQKTAKRQETAAAAVSQGPPPLPEERKTGGA